MERSSGIILPIYSLPSPHGIGTFGREAYAFADFLHAAGQRFWQILPLNPTGYGDSPYQGLSTFAGNPYFIDIELLMKDDLLTGAEVKHYDASADPRYVDYGQLYNTRYELLTIAKQRGWARDSAKIIRFINENESWLNDYALFMALKRHFDMRSWQEWPDWARKRSPADIKRHHEALVADMELFIYIQYLFFEQWQRLKAYVNSLGIEFIGDVPMYVALDSCDVWAEPMQFLLDDEMKPLRVAGVPPDRFSDNGQLWGNPLYRWNVMKQDGFNWWLRRLAAAGRMYDVIRLDHFRGFESYWTFESNEASAQSGCWEKGPGLSFFDALKANLPKLKLIAEDLGMLTPEVNELLINSGLPGMKVLEFAFDASGKSIYLPHNYDKNCVCYTGTHDNSPLALWFAESDAAQIKFVKEYFALNRLEGYNWGVIRGGMCSTAELFMAQMQDYLGLGDGHRTNLPGSETGNWKWRMLKDEASKKLAARIFKYTKRYGRA